MLIVEDEESFAEALMSGLGREGFKAMVARDGVEGVAAFDAEQPDVVLLDVMLPRMSGIDVCRQIRQRSSVPIIMVSAKGTEIDAVLGLEVGADDYVTKPYRLRELVARIRAVMRRAPPGPDAVADDGDVVSVGDVILDATRHEVHVRGEPVGLPLKEFNLLRLLMANKGRVLTRELLMERVWGFEYVGQDTKTIDVHVKRLRSKIEEDPAGPTHILTVRGLGYKFRAAERTP